MELFNLIVEQYQWLKVVIGELPHGQSIKFALHLLGAFSFFFLFISLLERVYGLPFSSYRSRNFLHDVIYWFYYYSGLGKMLLMGPALFLIGDNLDVFKLGLLDDIPFIWQLPINLLLLDFLGYWVHHMQHAIPFLWAFHTTHHAPRELSFASTARFHPVEQFLQNFVVLVPVLILGGDARSSVVVYYLLELNAALQHSKVPWRYGPLYYIFSSPRFHNFHHSMESQHQNRNFGGFFSFYDFIFGTAVDEAEAPRRLGIKSIEPSGFLSTLYTPFLILYQQYSNRRVQLRNETS
jgi:sterol desaturase/sphingolipid hydroxylase (fatty acid hydroxylase superfamily)